jgi:type I restriction enzyme S subunit
VRWREYPRYKPSGVEWLGEIPEQWEVLRLKNIARFGYGDSLSAGDRIPGDYDVYGSNGIVDQHERPNTKGPCLIIGRKGSFGKVAYSENPCFAIDTTYFIDSTLTRNDLRWLYYCLQWLHLDSFTKDSAVPGLSREDAYENFVLFCPIDEQRAIAAFLDRKTGRIDALITKVQESIDLLKEYRTALISHAVTKGLAPPPSR